MIAVSVWPVSLRILLPPLSSSGTTGEHCCARLFTWLLGIQIHVVMLVPSPLSHLSTLNAQTFYRIQNLLAI